MRGIDLAHATVIIQNDHMRGKAVADVALGVGNVGAQLVGRLQVHVPKLAALERLDGGSGILRMHTLAGDEFLCVQLIGATVVVLDLDAITMSAHRSIGCMLAGLDVKHGIAQQEGGTAHGLAGHDRLTRARRGAGVGSVLGRALAIGDAAKRQAACLGNVLQKDRVAALADVGRGSIDHGHAVLDANLAAAGIGQAHAHAGVLHGAGDTGVSGMRIVGILDLEQRLLQRRGAVGNLPVGQNLARLDGVTVADLPRIQADLLGQQVDQALERKLGLANAKAAVRAGGRVVGVVAKAANVGILVLVGADGMRTGALEHRAAQRRVGAGIKVDLAIQAGKVALGVAAQCKGAVHGVALGMERERLGTRELALHGTLELICGERGQVLDGHVLLAAKAAAHEHGLDDHALGLAIPAKHVGALFTRVVGALVGRLHLDAVLVREGDGALGLQESMLGKGRSKALRHGERALRQRLGGVATRHVTALAYVVLELHRVAKGKEAVVQARSVGSPGLGDVAHGFQRLVINLDELLGLLERRLVLGNHQHDGIAHAAGDIALGDHDVPVLDKVADLVDRHVLGAQNAHHAGQGLGLGGIDGEHAGTRVLRAHGAGIGQARLVELVDVVGVLALAEHLLAHVDTEGALAHAVVIAALQVLVDLLFAAEHRGCQRNALDNLLVAGATADVAANGVLDLFLGGLGVLGDECRTRHDHAGDAKAALHGAHGAKGVHKGLAHVLGQALDGYDVTAGGKRGGQHARLDGRTVHVDGAGTARALGAAVLGGVNMQVVAQIAQQWFILRRRVLDTVNGKSEFLCHGDSLLHAGGNAGAVVNGAMRAHNRAHAARQAVRAVDMGAVVLDANSAGRALFGAHAATDAARVADLARNGALVGVVTAHQDVLVAGNEGNHALRARHAAQAAARALGAVHAGNAVDQ